MIEATLAEIRKPETLYSYHDEIVHIIDGRKKEEVGFFVPKSMAKEFQAFIDNIEKTTLGDISELAALKSQMEADEKKDK
jgi:predicted DNA-binding protein (UPF0278 family)